MRVDEVAVFVNVLEAGSFAGAARRLRMPKSTVSAKLAALERRLGVTLIQRTTRALRPTASGQAFFERCRLGLLQLEAAEAELGAREGHLAGRLRITAPVDICQSLLPDMIAGFRAEAPGVEVEVIVTDRLADLIGEGIDLAIRAGPLRDSSLVSRAFLTGPTGFFASRNYLDRNGTPTTLDELAGHQLIGFGKLGGEPLRLTDGNKLVEVKLGTALACDNFLMTRAFLRLDLGIGFLPGFLAAEDGKRSNPLVRVFPKLASPQTGLFFAYPAQRFLPYRVRRFIDFAARVAAPSG